MPRETAINIVELFEHQARRRAQSPAFVTSGRAVSYGDALESVYRMAAALRRVGIEAGTRVAIRVPNSPAHLIAFFALARLGAVAIVIHPQRSAERLVGLADRFAIHATIGDEPSQAIEGTRLVLLDNDLLQPIDATERARPHAPGGDALLMVALSSGTSGAPKAIAWSHQRTVANWEQLQLLRPNGPGVRTLVLMGFDANGALRTALRQLFSGGTVVTIAKIGPAAIADAIDRLGVNEVLTSPALITRLVDSLPDGQQRFQGRASFRLAGAVVPAELLARFQSRLGSNVCSEYGASEVGAITSGVHGQVGRPTGSAGYRIPWVEAQAVDAEGVPLPAGQTGTLRFRSASFPSGYMDDPERSARVFRDGWFYPGDIGRVMPDDTIEVDTRADDQINIDGMKVNPLQIEAVLLEDPLIAEAAAYAVETRRGTQMLLAAVVCRGEIDERLTLQRCAVKLGPATPQRLVTLKALPRNEAGKVLRRQLVAQTRIGPAAPAPAVKVG